MNVVEKTGVKYKKSHLFVSPGKLIFRNLILIILASLLFGCDKELDIAENTDDSTTKDSIIELEEFVVMSFNLRNEVGSDPQTLDERKWNIRKVILDSNPDILGVQEIAADWMSNWLSHQLDSAGYDKYLSSGQFGSPKIIYYKRNRFSRQEQGTFQMQFTDNRAGTWIILLDKLNNKSYFLSNSHWTTVSSEERVETAKIILDIIIKNSQGLPLIIFGDFNAKPGTPEITTMKDANRF